MSRVQEEGCWQHSGKEKLQVQRRSTHDESSFGDWGYEVTMQHEDDTKVDNETK